MKAKKPEQKLEKSVERRERVPFGRSPKRVTHQTVGESRTQQQFKQECDIRNIVNNNNKTRLLDKTHPLEFEGIAEAIDPNEFVESMNTIVAAQQQFETLPAKLRDRFANKPENFLEFMQNEENIPEMEKLRLFSPEAIERVKQARKAAKDARKASKEGPPQSPAGGNNEPAEPAPNAKKR